MLENKEDLIKAVIIELVKAQDSYPAFHSAHEGYAVLAEEVDELWEGVKLKNSKRNPEAMQKECVQIAAMAIRFAIEVCYVQRALK